VQGRTCAVLGCGVDVAYPQRHRRLFHEISERGCLLSSFPPGAQPLPWHFPARNELMAVLADLVVIIEARADSGSLITARQARRHGRALAAFPGSAGTAAALAAGAQPVQTVADVLALLAAGPAPSERRPAARGGPAEPPPVGPRGRARRAAGAPPAPSVISEFSAAADGLLAVLAQTVSPHDLGELCARTGLSPGDCAAALVDLELRGRCTRLAGGRYIVHAPLG
jgi:DNA processing protein